MPVDHADDEAWMRRALELARYAQQQGEVPVGAVIVKGDMCVGEGWNQTITACDPCAHAEVVAIRAAAESLDNYRLLDTRLYVTLEPCSMCAGAIVQARIPHVIYGAVDPRAGAAGSCFDLLDSSLLNHRASVTGGVLEQACGAILKDFFLVRR